MLFSSNISYNSWIQKQLLNFIRKSDMTAQSSCQNLLIFCLQEMANRPNTTCFGCRRHCFHFCSLYFVLVWKPDKLKIRQENCSEETQWKIPLEKTGLWPVSCSNTFEALVSLSPDSPTQMFRQSFTMRRSRMGFFSLSFLSFVS